MLSRVVIVHSGGLDSTVLLYHYRALGHEVKALAVDYGQRHREQELAASEAICQLLGVERRVVDLTALVDFFGQNALTQLDLPVPTGEYAEQTIGLSTVPNRNMVMLSIGLTWAGSLGFDAVAYGAHGGTHTNYPDCQPAFAAAMDGAARVCDFRPLRVLAPFIDGVKADIIRRGAELGVPFERTWSCYSGGALHCGQCGTCVDRRTAFSQAGVADPTRYAG